ncbi:hypothetical protein BDV12DRAFT_199755 [Aspergillus spectabilis]
MSTPTERGEPPIKLAMDRDIASTVNPDDTEDTNADPPYSQLIYAALLTAPGNKLPLQDVYLWFEINTAKGRDRRMKGWQNSIPHNLSMNAGFEAVRDESPGNKAVNYWRLTDEAAPLPPPPIIAHDNRRNRDNIADDSRDAPPRQPVKTFNLDSVIGFADAPAIMAARPGLGYLVFDAGSKGWMAPDLGARGSSRWIFMLVAVIRMCYRAKDPYVFSLSEYFVPS